jgi:NTP pyrophosphatase (non-canonical NTP hydrolase)
MPADSLEELNRRLVAFARDRDWEQFHSPKNLAMAMIAECAELVEHFQWLTEEQSYALPAEKKEAVALELADILIYLLRCSERLDIDLLAAVYRKIALNEARYPAERVRGDARRASEYEDKPDP